MIGINYLRWIAVALIAALGSLVGLSSIQAQNSPDPIILNIQGDLWAWDGADQPMAQLTGWGMNAEPILSPDGTRVAYKSVASIFVDWLQTVEGSGGFTPPENIWILDLPSRQTFRVADQPADAVWNGPVEPGKYVLRTQSVWSPDGQQLAWVEFLAALIPITNDTRTDTAQIIVYDLVSQTTRLIDSFPVSNRLARSGLFTLNWGEAGIVLNRLINDQAVTALEIRIYDLSGSVITEIHSERLTPDQWIQYQEQAYLFDQRGNFDQWLNWHTGEAEAMPGSPEMYSLTAPDGASLFASGDTWSLALPDQPPVDLGEDIRPFGISRDGQSAVYGRWELNPATGYFAYTVLVQSQGQLIEIGRYQNVQPVWGPTGWRVRS
ncbi:MAG: hypothetical protein ABI690_14335 [Chloroflexota bacterium]